MADVASNPPRQKSPQVAFCEVTLLGWVQKRVVAIQKNLPKALEDYELAGCNAPRGYFPM